MNFDPLANATCTHDYFFGSDSVANKCFVATCFSDDDSCCSSQYDFINFYGMTYCWFGGLWWVTALIGIILIVLIFRFISSLVEEYLAPAVSYIASSMGLSEAMSAVTLLALANGNFKFKLNLKPIQSSITCLLFPKRRGKMCLVSLYLY